MRLKRWITRNHGRYEGFYIAEFNPMNNDDDVTI